MEPASAIEFNVSNRPLPLDDLSNCGGVDMAAAHRDLEAN